MDSRFSTRRRAGRLGVKPIATINVTSLLDITLVLLIAFMIVAPALNYGLDVRLPEVEATPVQTEDKALVISVTMKGRNDTLRLYVGQEVVDFNGLEEKLNASQRSLPKPTMGKSSLP